MKTNWIKSTIGLLACLSFGTQSFAWSGGGHKVVALIAYGQLNDAQRAKVIEILENHPLWEKDFEEELSDEIGDAPAGEQQRWLFAQAAIWPDIARKYTNYHHESWHYINEPVYVNQASRD